MDGVVVELKETHTSWYSHRTRQGSDSVRYHLAFVQGNQVACGVEEARAKELFLQAGSTLKSNGHALI